MWSSSTHLWQVWRERKRERDSFLLQCSMTVDDRSFFFPFFLPFSGSSIALPSSRSELAAAGHFTKSCGEFYLENGEWPNRTSKRNHEKKIECPFKDESDTLLCVRNFLISHCFNSFSSVLDCLRAIKCFSWTTSVVSRQSSFVYVERHLIWCDGRKFSLRRTHTDSSARSEEKRKKSE